MFYSKRTHSLQLSTTAERTAIAFSVEASGLSFAVSGLGMYVCMHARMYVCMYVCMHACMYACMYVCMCVCMYVCMYAGVERVGSRNEWLTFEG